MKQHFMKTLFTFISFICSLHIALAQDFLPALVTFPRTGIDALQDDYPDIMEQSLDSNNIWWDSRHMTWLASDVIPGLKRMKNESWRDVNGWTNVYVLTDSFILDGSSRLKTAFEDLYYNYPGFSSRQRLKYNLSYNSDGSIQLINVLEASPPTSYSFKNSYYVKPKFESSGRRIADTSYYFSSNQTNITLYIYNDVGQVTSEYYLDKKSGDTLYAAFYGYAGQHLSSAFGKSKDDVTKEWQNNNADTFEYNVKGEVMHKISYGFTSTNGVDFTFQAYNNESYEYSPTGKLSLMEQSFWDDSLKIWNKSRKYEIMYNRNDLPITGYIYNSRGTGWESNSQLRWIFYNLSPVPTPSTFTYDFTMFPNPCSDYLNFDFGSIPGMSDVSLVITDIAGRVVKEAFVSRDKPVNVSDLTPGIYVAKFQSAEFFLSGKVIVER